jgi:hypothetical protein
MPSMLIKRQICWIDSPGTNSLATVTDSANEGKAEVDLLNDDAVRTLLTSAVSETDFIGRNLMSRQAQDFIIQLCQTQLVSSCHNS